MRKKTHQSSPRPTCITPAMINAEEKKAIRDYCMKSQRIMGIQEDARASKRPVATRKKAVRDHMLRTMNTDKLTCVRSTADDGADVYLHVKDHVNTKACEGNSCLMFSSINAFAS